MGVKVEKFLGIPEVFQKHYGHVRAAAYSIAGASYTRLFSVLETRNICRWEQLSSTLGFNGR